MANRTKPLANRIADDDRPSDALKKVARSIAKDNGHSLGWWEAKENGTWTARCTECYRVASVIPALLTKDGRGMGGKALAEACLAEA